MADKSEIKKQGLFSELTDAELDLISKKVVVEQYPKGKPIFQAGETTKGIYLVKSGKVEISLMTADGWKQTLAVLADGQIFGELSVIEDKKTHGANATAIEETAVYRITADDFKALEKNDTVLMYKIMKTLARIASRKVNTMNEKLMKLLVSY